MGDQLTCTGGTAPNHSGCARSICAASLSNKSSRQKFPYSWMPIGNPSASSPAGSEIPGRTGLIRRHRVTARIAEAAEPRVQLLMAQQGIRPVSLRDPDRHGRNQHRVKPLHKAAKLTRDGIIGHHHFPDVEFIVACGREIMTVRHWAE